MTPLEAIIASQQARNMPTQYAAQLMPVQPVDMQMGMPVVPSMTAEERRDMFTGYGIQPNANGNYSLDDRLKVAGYNLANAPFRAYDNTRSMARGLMDLFR